MMKYTFLAFQYLIFDFVSSQENELRENTITNRVLIRKPFYTPL